MSFKCAPAEREPVHKAQQEAEGGEGNDTCPDKEALPAAASDCVGENALDIASANYRYSSLSSPTSVRLIELLPGKESDPISCSLRPVDLEDAQTFEALSYVWGDGRDRRSIFCFDHGSNSNPKTSTLLVTANCWHALRRLRLEDKTRVLWIDAICINQNQEDQGEKSQQVPLMGNLYRKASCVLVYLGNKDSAQLSEAFQLFKGLAVKMTSFPEGVSNLTAFDGVPIQAVLSFRKFFDRTWFKRCWTLQEIGLARRATLICDGDELDWDVFFSVICWINKYHPLDVIHLDLPTQELATSVGLYMTFEKEVTSSFQSQPDFLDILSATRSRECTDPHDRLYAFLGHPTALTKEGPLIRPSYIRNTWIVFYEFAISYLQRTQNLRILSAVDHGERLLPPTFPLSWVPWWNTSPCLCNFGLSSLYRASAGSEKLKRIELKGVPLANLEIDEVLADSPLFEWYDLMIPSSASLEDLEIVQQGAFNSIMTYQCAKMMRNLLLPGPTPQDVLEWSQPKEAKLTVRGLIFDEVKLMCPVLDREDFAIHSFSHDKDPGGHVVERLCYDISEKRFPSQYEDPLLTLSLTLVAGMHNSELIEDFEGHKESFCAYRHAVQNSRTRILEEGERREWLKVVADGAPVAADSVPDATPLLSGTLWRRFMVDAVQECHGRRFFPTESGYFGLGPAAIGGWHNSDMLCCIFFGASVPFILQKHGDIYRLVGDAYVHGFMNGEAIEMWKRGELEEVDFQLF